MASNDVPSPKDKHKKKAATLWAAASKQDGDAFA